MPLPEPLADELTPANLIADMGYPLQSETIQIRNPLPLGSIISRDPTTGEGVLVTAANVANVFGVLRDTCFYPDNLMVVYTSGAFIRDTLKTDSTTSVAALEGRLRELNIYAKYAVRYPSEPLPPAGPTITGISPLTAVSGSGPLTLTVAGRDFLPASIVWFADAEVATTFVSSTMLTAQINPTGAPGTRSVVVITGQEASNRANFIVT